MAKNGNKCKLCLIQAVSSFFLSAVLSFTMVINVFGGTGNEDEFSKTFFVNELSMNVAIPAYMNVLTRDTAPADETLAYLKLDHTGFLTDMQNNNIYLNAISLQPFFEIVVSMQPYSGSDEKLFLSSFTQEELLQFAENLKNNVAATGKAGLAYSAYTFRSYGSAVYIILDYENTKDDKTVHGKQYFTIYNGQAISISSVYLEETPDAVNRADNTLQFMVENTQFTHTEKECYIPPVSKFTGNMMLDICLMFAAGAIFVAGLCVLFLTLSKKRDEQL